MLTISKLLLVALAFLDVRVSTLNEESISGDQITIDKDNLVVTKDDKKSRIALGDVIDITFTSLAEAEAVAPKGEQLSLTDGTQLKTGNLTASADTISTTSDALGELNVPRKAVRAIRLQPSTDVFAGEWAAFLKRENTKDLLVYAKPDGAGLDYFSGVVTSIGDEKIPFLLDGQELPFPRNKAFGIVFATGLNAENQTTGDIAVTFRDRSIIRVESVEAAGNEITLKTSWGQTARTLAHHVSTIDFSGGRIHQLSDLKPLSENYFGLDPPDKSWGALFEKDEATREGISRMWKMSRNQFPNSGRPQLTLRGRTFAKGLCIFPSAEIEYALDGKYSSLRALVGVDDEVAFNQLPGKPPTVVELRIEADGNPVFERLIKAPEDPINLDIKLNEVTTLTIIVDFGDGASTCDYLDIVNARLFVDTSAK